MGFQIHHGVRNAVWGGETHEGRSLGFGMHHGVRNTPWGEKCIKGRAQEKGDVRYNPTRRTQLGSPFRLWPAKPPSPCHCVRLPVLVCMLPKGKDREREEV